jgi:cation:H+ antiporter
MGVSPFIVGLTIVGFGTSAPELVVSVDSALAGSPGIAVGNVIGSNMANIMLIVGAAALIRPLAVHPDALGRDGVAMTGATILFLAVAFSGTMGRGMGAVFLCALILYLAFSLWWDARRSGPAAALHGEEAAELAPILPQRLWVLIVVLIAGLAALIAGSRLAVTGATAIARDAGISEEIIGITLVAVGTSLPELATAIMAAKRGHADVCLGNVIGSNIFNLLGIAGAAAVAAPLSFELDIIRQDLWALIGVTCILIAMMLTGRRVERWEGAALLTLYALYITYHLMPGGIVSALMGGS